MREARTLTVLLHGKLMDEEKGSGIRMNAKAVHEKVRNKKIKDRYRGKEQVYYEVKKVFCKTRSRMAILLLMLVMGVTFCFAMNVEYINEEGEAERGFSAVARLWAAQKEWSGDLNEEKIRQVIAENRRINETPEGRSERIKESNIAYGWKQGIAEIRSLLNCAYADGFRHYDYYLADSLSEAEAGAFYRNRIKLLREWLAGEAKDQYSEAEKTYLIRQYESLEMPCYYDYRKGWTQLFTYAPTVVMITMLFLGYLVAGIFSNEFTWKTDAVFFASYHGRDRAVAAKVWAGVWIVTGIYWLSMLFYSAAVLGYLGVDGWNCPVQTDFTDWKCFYHLTVWQKYLLIVSGGYVGCMFMAGLCMLVSAKTKSAVVAVMVPFVLIFLPSFLGNLESGAVNKILGLLPDRLLQVGNALGYFDLYTLGGRVIGAVPILLVLYGILTVAVLPIVYRCFVRS